MEETFLNYLEIAVNFIEQKNLGYVLEFIGVALMLALFLGIYHLIRRIKSFLIAHPAIILTLTSIGLIIATSPIAYYLVTEKNTSIFAALFSTIALSLIFSLSGHSIARTRFKKAKATKH